MAGLHASAIKKLTNPGLYHDGRGLYFRIAPGGSKSWVQRISLNGKRTDKGLGSYHDVSLAAARRKSQANREALAEGNNPWAKPEPACPTFHEAARQVHALRAPTFRREITGRQWWQALEKHALPSLGDMPVDAITAHDVLAVLMPIWNKNPEVSRKIRQRIRTILQFGVVSGWTTFNVADDRLNVVLPRQHRQNKNFRSLPYVEVAQAISEIEASAASMPSKLAFRFLVLTACRSVEARGATWSEIDLQNRIWEIPADRMKTGKLHRVPLSDAALAVLAAALPFANESGLLFPSPQRRKTMLSSMTLTKLLRDVGLSETSTIHGFRSSFRSWALECSGASWAAAEAALSHAIGDSVQTAYIRSDLLEERRELMQIWADYLA